MFVLIDMIYNIILNPYYVTRTPANESAVYKLYIFLETGTSGRTRKGSDQKLK